jgi:hypothetical protein
MVREQDVIELEHLRDGGRYCIDGRKQNRLIRLGYIENHPKRLGFQTSLLGVQALKIYKENK